MPSESKESPSEAPVSASSGETGQEPKQKGEQKEASRPPRRFGRKARRAQGGEGSAAAKPAAASDSASAKAEADGSSKEAEKRPARARRRSRFRKESRSGGARDEGRAKDREAKAKPAEGERRPRKPHRKPRYRRDRGKRRGRNVDRHPEGDEEAVFKAISEAMVVKGAEPLNLQELKAMSITDLHHRARELSLDTSAGVRKQDLVFGILKALCEGPALVRVEGVVEIMKEGYGFLRFAEYNYLPSPHDIYASPNMIRRSKLRVGDTATGFARPPSRKRAIFRLNQGPGGELRASGSG